MKGRKSVVVTPQSLQMIGQEAGIFGVTSNNPRQSVANLDSLLKPVTERENLQFLNKVNENSESMLSDRNSGIDIFKEKEKQ